MDIEYDFQLASTIVGSILCWPRLPLWPFLWPESSNPFINRLFMSDTSVDIVIEGAKEAGVYSRTFTLWPRQWATYSGSHKWQLTRLVHAERDNIPDSSGVYTLIVIPEIADHPACSYIMYVGQAVSLRRRFREYLTKERKPDGRPKIFVFLNMYPCNVWFCSTLVQRSSLDSVETGLRDAYLPPLNDVFAGKLSQIVKVLR